MVDRNFTGIEQVAERPPRARLAGWSEERSEGSERATLALLTGIGNAGRRDVPNGGVWMRRGASPGIELAIGDLVLIKKRKRGLAVNRERERGNTSCFKYRNVANAGNR